MAPSVHPLIRMGVDSPLAWFNQGLARHGLSLAFSDYVEASSGHLEWRLV